MKTFQEFIQEAYSILDEDAESYARRQENKKARGRKGKTPLKIKHTRTYREAGPWRKTSAGLWTKSTGKKVVDTRMVGNPAVSSGRYMQGGGGGSRYGYKRHPHGGAADWTPAGSERGVKKVKGAKTPEVGHTSPAQKVANRRAKRAMMKAGGPDTRTYSRF